MKKNYNLEVEIRFWTQDYRYFYNNVTGVTLEYGTVRKIRIELCRIDNFKLSNTEYVTNAVMKAIDDYASKN